MKTLETERLIMRDWEISDLDDFSEMWTNPNVTIPQGDLPKLSKEDCLPLLKYLIDSKNNYALVLKGINKVIGSVGLNEDGDGNSSGKNLGYMLNEIYWNNGYMQEALKEIISCASEFTSFLSAVILIKSNNNKSKYIIEKLGFEFIKLLSEPNNDMAYYVLNL